MIRRSANIDEATVLGFGEEWASFTQEGLGSAEQQRLFDQYFSIFPFDRLPQEAEGFDLGCGTGRWAELAAARVGHLHCIDPAAKALAVARQRLKGLPNVRMHECGVDDIPLADGSQDFGYSLGVLHHIPDTEGAMATCVRKLKPGAPFLAYIYYAFDNRPGWYRSLWRVSELGRRAISRLPFSARKAVTGAIATLVYWPLARTASLLEAAGANVRNVPLAEYRHHSFYTMRTDALDRFGTRLEQRFSKAEIEAMMRRCGLEDIRFREGPPFWVACGRKAGPRIGD
jgi:ubiquinone/menaquinone biosynthesis C-methylase UbiE